MTIPPQDWDPMSRESRQNQIAAFDAQRRAGPVAHSEAMHWSLLGHADVMRALLDHETFSNVVSAHPAVPNGMDPPEHAAFRTIIDPYFGPGPISDFAPRCRRIADTLAARLPDFGEADLMTDFAQEFALEAQCAFMGWPETLFAPLRRWVHRSAEATRSRDRTVTAAVAAEFEGYVADLLAVRRAAGDAAPDDATTRLMRERIDGRPLTDAEIASIVRNWTVGELGTIAASIGIVIHYLIENPALEATLRADPSGLVPAIDEILRIHAPLIANRRTTACPVEVGGRSLGAGERITLIWASANRDEAVFGDPDAYDPEGNAARNLLYGAGIHVCPGAPLARAELAIAIDALLRRAGRIAAAPGKPPVRAVYPGAGFSSLPVRIEAIAGAG